MDADPPADLVLLAVEVAGVSLTATLLALLARDTGRPFVRWWAAGWTVLAASLAWLLAWSVLDGARTLLLAPFLLGSYGFALAIARGFAVFDRAPKTWRHQAWLGGVLAAWSVALPGLAGPSLVLVHGLRDATMAVLLGMVFALAWRLEPPGAYRTGRRVVVASLGALIVDLAAIGPLARLGLTALEPLSTLASYHALLDTLLLTGLGFGQVLLVMESVSADLARTNRELGAARDRLEVKASTDPLTNALNRHAFHALFAERAAEFANRPGCVAIIDIDDLKALNDTLGHGAGDQAIRATATTIRHMIRADDLLFRWGGDEFLAVLFGLTREGADARLRALAERQRQADGAPGLSWGTAYFEDLSGLGEAIEVADRAMYAGRAHRRADPRAAPTREASPGSPGSSV